MPSLQDSVKVAQAALKLADPSLVIDGWWGSFTQAVYARAPQNIRAAVDQLLAGANQSALMLQKAAVNAKAAAGAAGDDWIPKDKAEAIAVRAAQKHGIDVNAFVGFLGLEPAKVVKAGVVYYNTKSVHGSFKGLFQMGSAAWTDASKIDSTIGSYATNAFDAVANSNAAAAFAKSNVKTARSQGYNGPITSNVLYTMHNQGIGGFLKAWKSGKTGVNFANQSDSAQKIILAGIVDSRRMA